MAENIVVMTLPTHSGTYEAFSKLKSAAGFDLNAAVIIERDADGIAHLAEGRDYQAGAATTGGSLIGMLVGILGGPLGMLLGLGAGALTGSLIDADRLDLGDDVISDFAKVVPPGGNAILAQVVEDAPAALNAFADSVSATVVRRPVEEVVAEIEPSRRRPRPRPGQPAKRCASTRSRSFARNGTSGSRTSKRSSSATTNRSTDSDTVSVQALWNSSGAAYSFYALVTIPAGTFTRPVGGSE